MWLSSQPHRLFKSYLTLFQRLTYKYIYETPTSPLKQNLMTKVITQTQKPCLQENNFNGDWNAKIPIAVLTLKQDSCISESPLKVPLNLRTFHLPCPQMGQPQKYDFIFNYTFKFSPSKKPNLPASYSLGLPQSLYLLWDITDCQF